jgi:hypothetical protein
MQKLMRKLVQLLRGRATQRRLQRFAAPAPRPRLRWFFGVRAERHPILAPVPIRMCGPR